jgi:hypothetical protein
MQFIKEFKCSLTQFTQNQGPRLTLFCCSALIDSQASPRGKMTEFQTSEMR